MIISEGLINYFDKTLLNRLLQGISEYGQDFERLHYLTDIYPEPVKNKLANFIWTSSKLLKVMSRSSFTFHFINPLQIHEFFQNAGFQQVEVLQPINSLKKPNDSNVIPFLSPDEPRRDLVWVISQSSKKQRS